MRIPARCFATSVLVVIAATVVSTKGPTVKLTVSAPHLQRAMDVTSQPALVHVWGDEFIGAPASQPRGDLPQYQVAFHVLPHGKREPRVAYVVTYVHDPVSGDAFIYLPGPGEEHYTLNVSTILREGRDGRWHHALPGWADALNRSLPR